MVERWNNGNINDMLMWEVETFTGPLDKEHQATHDCYEGELASLMMSPSLVFQCRIISLENMDSARCVCVCVCVCVCTCTHVCALRHIYEYI